MDKKKGLSEKVNTVRNSGTGGDMTGIVDCPVFREVLPYKRVA